MQEFRYSLKTDVIFGKDKITELPSLLGMYGKKVLLVYGGSSIKRSGLYDTICGLLKDFELFELGGICSNPQVSYVNAGAKICRREGIDVVLAVGGGSVMDASKAIGLANYYEGDAWDLITQQAAVEKCLPLVCVLTMAASGSEVGCGAVISNPATNEKLGIDHPEMYFRHVIMDPTYTMTLPAYQTACGAVDVLSHLMEQYFTGSRSLLSCELCEGVMRTVVHYAPVAVREPENEEARAQLMWAASLANNGILSLGNDYSGWPCHAIEHELSAYHNITHGLGLAIVTPAWMRHVTNERTASAFARFGREIFCVDAADDVAAARQAADCLQRFFESLSLATSLEAAGITLEKTDEICEHAVEHGWLSYAWCPLTPQDVRAILDACASGC